MSAPAAAQFSTVWNGPDELFVEENCLAYLYWTGPTPEKSLFVTSTGGNPVTVVLASITRTNKKRPGANYQLRDSVPEGDSLRLRYTFEDQSGNMGFRNVTLLVLDTVPPEFDLNQSPPDITVNCIYELNTPTVEAVDNCTDSLEYTFTQTAPPAPCTGGTMMRTWIATDASGNQVTFDQNVTVRPDTIPPTYVRGPKDTSAHCASALGNTFLTWLDEQLEYIIADDPGCGVATISHNAPDTSILTQECGDVEIVFTAQDSCGNSTDIAAVFHIIDTIAPSITLAARDTAVSCASAGASEALSEWLFIHGGAQADDDCGLISWTTEPETPDIANICNDTLTVMFVASDACGNSTMTEGHFIITDRTPPFLENEPIDLEFSCDTVQNIAGAFQVWRDTMGYGTALDHCNEVLSFAAAPGSYSLGDATTWPGRLPRFSDGFHCRTPDNPGGTYIDVDFVFHDGCGNAIVQNNRFTIYDRTAPQITACPDDITATTDINDCLARVEIPLPEAEEDCLTGFRPVELRHTERITSIDPGNLEVPVDTVRMRIPAHGPYDAGSLTDAQLTLEFFNLDANDPGEFFTIIDEDGNSMGQTPIQTMECVSFTMQISDIPAADMERWVEDDVIELAFFTNIPAGMSTRAAINDKCGGSSVNAILSFAGGVTGELQYFYSLDSGSFQILDPNMTERLTLVKGEYTLDYRVSDCQGNYDSCSIAISVTDAIAPDLACPENRFFSLDSGTCLLNRSVPLPEGLEDNCAGLEFLEIELSGATTIGPIRLSPPFSPQIFTFEKGETTIQYLVRDSSGNEATCSFVWTVNDQQGPIARCRSIAISLDPSGLTNYVIDPSEIDNGSGDNCGPVMLSVFPDTFDCSQQGQEVPVRLIVVDEGGLSNRCDAIVRVLVPVLEPKYTVDICGNDTLQLFANTPQGPGMDPFTYAWTGPNGFTSNQRDPKRPSANESFSGEYRVVATGFNGCESEGTVQVFINNLNTPSIRSDKTVYCNNEEVLLEATAYAGQVEYQWYEGVPPSGVLIDMTPAPNLLIKPTVGRHRYYVIVTSASCTTNPSLVYQIDIENSLDAEVNEPFISICEGESIVLGTPTVGAGYTYQWSGPNGYTSDQQNPPVIQMADPNMHAGTYQLIVSNGSCNSLPVEVEVEVVRKPVRPTIELNGIPCEGDSINLFVGNIQQGDRYIWTKPDGSETLRLNDYILPVRVNKENEGIWRVRVIIGGCSSETSLDFVLNIEDQINFGVINDGPVCAGDSVSLSAELIAGATYRWTGPGNFRSNQRTPKALASNGIYTVELTTENGCTSTSETRVEVKMPPNITALSSTGDSTCVTGTECVILTPTVFPPDNGQYTYSWIGPNMYTSSGANPCVPNATEAINGTYSLVVNDGECPSQAASTVVRVFNVPDKPGIDGDQIYCVGDMLFLSATTGTLPGSARYRWSTPRQEIVTGNPTIRLNDLELSDEGYYYVVIENGPCLSPASDSIYVRVSTPPDRPIALPLAPVCEGDSVRLKSTVSGAGTYTWFGPNAFRSNDKSPLIYPVTPANAGTYSLRVTIGSCQSPLSVPVTLVVREKPSTAVLDIPPTITRYCIDDPESSIEICADPSSLTDTAIYRVLFTPSGTILGQTSDDCFNLPTSSLRPGQNRIVWVGDNMGCLSDPSNELRVIGDNYPADRAMAGMDLEICDSMVTLMAGIPGIAVGSWSSNDPNITFANQNAPTTEVSGLRIGSNIIRWSLNYFTCVNYSVDSIEIFRDKAPLLLNDNVDINPGQTTEIDVLANDDIPFRYTVSIVTNPRHGSAEWTTNDQIRYIPENSLPGIDSLQYRVCTENCPDLCHEAWVYINKGVDDDCSVPTIITPNNDGYNDRLIIPCLITGNYPSNKLSVFNQWGDEVFSASPYLNDWEGDYKGRPLPDGSYYYVFNKGQNESNKAGFIIIKR